MKDNRSQVNDKSNVGRTALHDAFESSPMNVVHTLIDAGADINAATNNKQLPLHMACSSKVEAHEKIELLVTKFSADVNAADELGETPLHFACRHQTKQDFMLLLKKGANALATDQNNLTPLHIACEDVPDSVAKVQAIIARDKDCLQQFDAGHTPLHHACDNGSPEVIKLLIDKGANVNAKSDDTSSCGTYPLHFCFRNTNFHSAKLVKPPNQEDTNLTDVCDRRRRSFLMLMPM